ncbi:hypothetical protein [Dokdonella sp.]|uniref:hypothetical protein n=1 Tax=Dokdonella sp. TaxID=2291710 RepID=UPI0031C3A134|nr:hypothetical protein [Dokdonella sp.]
MMFLLPRLPGPACEVSVRMFLAEDPSRWDGFHPDNLPEQVRFAATGGTPVTSAQLADLRQNLVTLAERHGFGRTAVRLSLADVDAEIAGWLAESELFSTGEALRDDVWAFIAAILAPDIVHWRFGAAMERYAGGVRNTFQRLWMRGRALDRGIGHPARWQLLEELNEDALVQIIERPSIGGDGVLALAVAEAWLRAARHHGRPSMEAIMRRAILKIRVRNEIRSLADLPPGDLASFLDEVFGCVPKPASLHVEQPGNPATHHATSNRQPAADTRVRDEAELSVSRASATAAILRVKMESKMRGWLSPKSQSALDALKDGRVALDRSERNALDYLLDRLSGAGVLPDDIKELQSVL